MELSALAALGTAEPFWTTATLFAWLFVHLDTLPTPRCHRTPIPPSLPPAPDPQADHRPLSQAPPGHETHFGARLDVGSSVQQQAHHDDVPPPGGNVQRGDAVLDREDSREGTE